MDWTDFRKRRLAGRELVVAVVQDAETKQVLMTAFQDEEAFKKTRETGQMHFYSTSKGKLWKKGEVSGNAMKVKEARVDCDADALLYLVDCEGGACHMGYDSCFYREIDGKIVGRKVFDPEEVY